MRRTFWVWLHRWMGLTMAGFLVIVGLTGSALAFFGELDHWLNPELFMVARQSAPLLDPLTLRERAEAFDPQGRADVVPLRIGDSTSVEFDLAPRVDPATGANYDLKFTQLFLNPYTGETLGARKWGEASLARQNILPFLFRLHTSLALPGAAQSWGALFLGAIALLWTIDCFVSFYLTFPVSGQASRSKSWLDRWSVAWRIKVGSGAFRLNFDIHRAFGLWTWAMLFIFAWSSVGFNLPAVFNPTMDALFASPTPPGAAPEQSSLRAEWTPRLDWPAALARGRELFSQQSIARELVVAQESAFALDRENHAYIIVVDAPGSESDESLVTIVFDADSGALREAQWTRDARPSLKSTVTQWLFALHMARVFGLPMKIFVFLMGGIIAALSFTGVYLWWKKRGARAYRRDAAALQLAVNRGRRS